MEEEIGVMEVRKPVYLTFAEVNRKHCLECCGFSLSAVRDCTVIDCASWPGRTGMKAETAAKKGYQVNPHVVAGKDYGEGHLKGTYREIVEDGPLWWELPIREIVRRFGLK